jgi:two-component system response regulator
MEPNTPHVTILIVEDNPDDAELAVIALRQGGVKTPYRIARNADEALEFALGRNLSAPESADTNAHTMATIPPTLILLDLKLPGKSGLEVLKELRAAPATRYVPIVVLTTSILEEDMIQSYENGANSFIRKPVDFSTFLREIDLVCHYWLETNLQPKKNLFEDVFSDNYIAREYRS